MNLISAITVKRMARARSQGFYLTETLTTDDFRNLSCTMQTNQRIPSSA
jgi:hypothetical protein